MDQLAGELVTARERPLGRRKERATRSGKRSCARIDKLLAEVIGMGVWEPIDPGSRAPA